MRNVVRIMIFGGLVAMSAATAANAEVRFNHSPAAVRHEGGDRGFGRGDFGRDVGHRDFGRGFGRGDFGRGFGRDWAGGDFGRGLFGAFDRR